MKKLFTLLAALATTASLMAQTATISWFNGEPLSSDAPNSGVASNADVFSSSSLSWGTNLTYKDAANVLVRDSGESSTQTRFASASKVNAPSEEAALTFVINISEGYTFTPSNLSFEASRYGTGDGQLTVDIVAGDRTINLFQNQKPPRDNGTTAKDEDASFAGLKFYTYSSNIEGLQDLSGQLQLKIYVLGVGSSKNYGFGNLTLTGSFAKTAEKCKAPIISLDENKVTITQEQGAEIRYTLDGTEPTAESMLYEAPFTVADGTTIKAIAIGKDGVLNSNIVEARYVWGVSLLLHGDNLSPNKANKREGEGCTLQITGKTDKTLDNSSKFVVEGVSVTTMKNSNGAQNTLTLPEGYYATEVTFYTTTNATAPADGVATNGNTGYFSEVDGVTYQFEDGKYETYKTSGDVYDTNTFPVATKNSFTFTASGKQVSFALKVKMVKAKEIYLAGQITNWATDNADYKFNATAPNTYTLNLPDGLKGEFKVVVDGEWYGSSSAKVGEVFNMHSPDNNAIAPTLGNTTFTLNVDDFTALIEGQEYMPVYFIGDMTTGETTDWKENKIELNTNDGVNYSYNFTNGITGAWRLYASETVSFGQAAGANFDYANGQFAQDAWFCSDNFAINFNDGVTLNFTLVDGSYEAGTTVASEISLVEDAAPVKIYFANNLGWETVKAHFFHDSWGTAWPGKEMNLEGNSQPAEAVAYSFAPLADEVAANTTYHSIEIPASATGVVINNDGAAQTEDIIPEHMMLYTPSGDTNSEGKYVVNKEPTTGVEDVEVENAAAEAVYYNLQGVRVDNPAAGNVYIRRQGAKTEKIRF